MNPYTPNAFLPKALFDEMLAQEPKQGKNLLEPLKTMATDFGLPIKLLEDHQVKNKAEVHLGEGDLWGCLSGEVTFVIGGEIVDPQVKQKKDGTLDPNELLADDIKDGKEVVVKPGDWLWIPAGQPHQHRTDGTARLIIIKIPLKK